ncbi:hypothetical protein QN277_026247 [Acacia crassicarpa]|uniref:Uncharacterized protein n=1 Tax=Acacia crassicarpa TaxID=499986 RepID=A0AAE1J7G9_9FABA|nr:hypothetical protein QN277_026247 [Acacia crassicarpa]
MSIEAMDTNNELKPRRSFSGKFLLKSLGCFREVNMERNMISAVTEKQSAISAVTAKRSNGCSPSSFGLPVLSSVPPGTWLDVAKETPATSAATTEQDSDVSLSHSLLFLTRSLCFSVKICSGVLSSLLVRKTKWDGAYTFTRCKY